MNVDCVNKYFLKIILSCLYITYSQIQSLRQRLDRADADLVHSRRENLRLSEQIATLEKEVLTYVFKIH